MAETRSIGRDQNRKRLYSAWVPIQNQATISPSEGRVRDGGRRFARHRCRSVAPRILGRDGKAPAARARIFRARVFESRQAGLRSASRTVRAFCQSREVLETTRANVRPDFLRDRIEAAVIREVTINLAIPGGAVALANKGSELRQFNGGKCLYGIFDFGETHREEFTEATARAQSSSVCKPRGGAYGSGQSLQTCRRYTCLYRKKKRAGIFPPVPESVLRAFAFGGHRLIRVLPNRSPARQQV